MHSQCTVIPGANNLALCAEAFGLDQPDSYNYLRRSSCHDDPTINDSGTFQDVLVRPKHVRVERAATLWSPPSLTFFFFFFSSSVLGEQSSMRMMQFTEENIREILRLLVGILHTGNIEFMTAGGAQVSSKSGLTLRSPLVAVVLLMSQCELVCLFVFSILDTRPVR